MSERGALLRAGRDTRTDDDGRDQVGRSDTFVPREHDQGVARAVVRSGNDLRNPRRQPRVAGLHAAVMGVVTQVGGDECERGQVPAAMS